jgi:hypothetical protein
MSVLSYSDIFPDLLATDLVVDHQHTRCQKHVHKNPVFGAASQEHIRNNTLHFGGDRMKLVRYISWYKVSTGPKTIHYRCSECGKDKRWYGPRYKPSVSVVKYE